LASEVKARCLGSSGRWESVAEFNGLSGLGDIDQPGL
jgi:hypothetical protein